MPEIGSSGLMSGDGKRGVGHRPQATAPILDSTRAVISESGLLWCTSASSDVVGCPLHAGTRFMRRRDFITIVGCAAAWPFSAQAQPAMPVIGYLGAGSLVAPYVVAFRQGLKEAGFDEPRNVVIEFYWADGQSNRLPELAATLVNRQVAVIVATGGNAPTQAAKDATDKIPIVFVSGGDPVKFGLVASLNRPGGNVTGVSVITTELGAKRLELLHQLVPKATKIGVIVNPNYADVGLQLDELKRAADAINLKTHVAGAGTERDIDTAVATLVQNGADALLVANDPFFNSHIERPVQRVVALPTSYHVREAVVSGGLMSYGASFADGYRQAGIYTGRILKGEKPADLPVQQSTKFEFVLNLKTAKALGLTIPPTLLATADEVIE
jgi:putative tryptophan/tyrosine transport system substrate-binding protein